MAYCRPARPEEDEFCARLLFNAFRLNWEINWTHDLSDPMPPLSLYPCQHHKEEKQENKSLSKPQYAHLEFYRACLRLTRRVGGNVDVVAIPQPLQSSDHTTKNEIPKVIAAVSCFFHPHIRLSLIAECRTGWLHVLYLLGIRGTYRFLTYSGLGEKKRDQVLRSEGLKEVDGAYCMLIASDPERKGDGYAGRLLRWQIDGHRQCAVDIVGNEIPPVYLEAAESYIQKIYESIGFRELGRESLFLNVDRQGLKTKGKTKEGFDLRALKLEMKDFER